MLLKIKKGYRFLPLIIFVSAFSLWGMEKKEYIYVWLPDKRVTEVREQVRKYLLYGLENAQKEVKILSEKVSGSEENKRLDAP